MLGSPTTWDSATVASALRQRRRWRLLLWLAAILLLASILADHFRPQNRHGDDWSRFDRHPALFVSASDTESVDLRDAATGIVTRVHPWGLASFNRQWDEKASRRLTALLAGHRLTLHLESPQTRDEQGRLLAYVFTEGGQSVSIAIVREGLALADRRLPYAFHTAVEDAENAARKKKTGLWATATDRMMPPWRQDWLRRRGEHFAN